MNRTASYIAVLFLTFCMTSPVRSESPVLYGGTARVNITPPVGCWLDGWAIRDRPSAGVQDPLFAKSIVLSSGPDTLAIVACDLIHVTREIVSGARAIIEQKTGLAGGNVLICATHTHFSPVVGNKKEAGEKADEAYLDVLTRSVASTVVMALKDMQPVRIGTARSELPELLFNRRTKRPDGKVVMTFVLPPAEDNLTFGPTDPTLNVLRVEDSEGRVLASMMNYACHPVSGGGHGTGWERWFYDISAEFPGVATRLVEDTEQGNCLFTLGAAGDMVPIERGVQPRFKIGKALGGDTIRLLQYVKTERNPVLAVASKQVELPVKTSMAADAYVSLPEEKTITAEIQVIRIGELYLVGLPGEVLTEVGLAIKAESPADRTVIVSLANASNGYICHREAYDEGGYEPDQATVLAPGGAELLAAESLRLIQELMAAN